MKQFSQKRIFIYELVSPGELKKNRTVIKKLLFPKAEIFSDETFRIDPVSGWMKYENKSRLNRNTQPQDLPLTEKAAMEKALQFIARHYEKCLGTGASKGIHPLLPRKVKLSSSQLVHNTETRQPDHWLLRFTIWLETSDDKYEPPVMLAGGGIDFRIGNRGEVWGLQQRYRPVLQKLALPLLGHGRSSEPLPDFVPPICYREDGPQMKQTHYAPHYLLEQAPCINYLPASEFSMEVNIQQDGLNNGQLGLSADVKGGYGHFAYHWLVRRLTRAAKTFKWTGPRINIPNHECCISLTVKDLVSEQVAENSLELRKEALI